MLMGHGSTLETWSTCGGWRWKKEDNIKEKEYPKDGGSKDWEENTVATRTRLVIKFKRFIYKD